MKTLGMTREEFIKKAYDLAHHREAALGGCPQAVFGAFQELLGIKAPLALKAASAFAGGIAHQGLTCGALIGGIMTISMKYGRSAENMEDVGAQVKAMELANKLMLKFKEEFDTLNCRDITGMKENSLEELMEFDRSGRHDSLCPEVCGKTAGMVAEILYDREQELLADMSRQKKFWLDL